MTLTNSYGLRLPSSLHFSSRLVIYLFEEEVVGKVVEHHGVAGVDGVGARQELHSVLDGVGLFVVELQNRQTDKRSHTLRIKLQGTAESQASLLQFVEFDETVAHPEPHLS